jgi:hypothetical protein
MLVEENRRKMAKRRKEWPEWWQWELKISTHMNKRFPKRDFTEIDLRRMMEHKRPILGRIATKDVGSSIRASGKGVGGHRGAPGGRSETGGYHRLRGME